VCALSHPPLSVSPTSPPQGGRSGSAKHVSFACTNSHRHPSNSNPLPQNAPHFFPTFRAHAILAVLPPPDGSRTFRLRREGMPRCDASRRRARHPGRRQPTRFRWRAAPLRGRAKPATGPGPDPSLRHAGRGGTSGPGLWRTCLRKREQGPCRNPRPKHLPRPVQAAAGATRAESPEEGQVDKPAPCACEAAACRMGTPSGEFRAARALRHPNTTCSEGTARARPSGLPACRAQVPALGRNVQAEQGTIEHTPAFWRAGTQPAVECKE